MASSLFVSSVIAIYSKWNVFAHWMWYAGVVCVCSAHNSSFHSCIVLNRHMKCNYKMSISVSILDDGRFLLRAILFHKDLTIPHLRKVNILQLDYFIWLYTQFPSLKSIPHPYTLGCNVYNEYDDVQSVSYTWCEIYLSSVSIPLRILWK